MSFPFDIHSAAVCDPHMPCHAHAMPRPCRSESDFSRPRHSAGRTRHGHGILNYHRPSRDVMWVTCWHSASSVYHTEFHEGYQKHKNLLNCRISSSVISDYHADFHEGHGTVGEWQGRGMACVN
jgi:hypothetical protein